VDGIVENSLRYSIQNNARIDNYHQLDISGVYDFSIGKGNKQNARIGVSVLNLYGQENEINTQYSLNENDENPEEVSIREEIRVGFQVVPNLVLRVWF